MQNWFRFKKRGYQINRNFWCSSLKSNQRIGPHNLDIISVMIGNILGDGYAEYRSGSTRVTLHLVLPNREYIGWLHSFYVEQGYNSSNTLNFKKQIGKQNKIYFSTKIRTFSFKSFNWLYELFYKPEGLSYKKCIPCNIEEFLTPLTLAIWFMNDGSRHNSGVLLHTNCYGIEDIKILQQAFLRRYNLKTSLHSKNGKWIIFFGKNNASIFSKIIYPYMHPSMFYKLKNL
jgi:hypothetical protein